MLRPRRPVATYRIQFSGGFGFEDARAAVPYLHALGISDLYASPIFSARPGSGHGYDVTDPTRLNPELGTDEDFARLVDELRAHGMGLLLDIVPNHLAASPDNPWWTDLLENGRASPYAAFFDIDWQPGGSVAANRVLLPVLGEPYRQAVEDRRIRLKLEEDGIFAHYGHIRLPLDVKSYGLVIGYGLALSVRGDGLVPHRLRQLLERMEHLPDHDAGQEALASSYAARQQVKEDFLRFVRMSRRGRQYVCSRIDRFNGKRGDGTTPDHVDRLLSQQAYELAFWRTGLNRINYRRFFDVSDLVGVRVEDPSVFAATHALVRRMVLEGKVDGLRIDHIDGLRDPLEYLRRLQEQVATQDTGEDTAAPGFYVVVEKILSGEESLREEWPVSGTTGYDFLNEVNRLFVDREGARAMQDAYVARVGGPTQFEGVVYEKKRQVIGDLFAAELQMLSNRLSELAGSAGGGADLALPELREALAAATACLPVYRTYTRGMCVSRVDGAHIGSSVEEAQRRDPTLSGPALGFLRRVLLLDWPEHLSAQQRQAWIDFVMSWQQFSGPVMAKGFEDTALYAYSPLLSLNEVGGDPDAAGVSVDEFHRYNLARQQSWPFTMNATSTHDTKRSEDSRGRINVLSEFSSVWAWHLSEWSRMNAAKKLQVNGQAVPDAHMELLIYQTLIGAWPLSPEDVPGFKERLKRFAVKAVREARVFSNWLSPNVEYEDAVLMFLEAILDSSAENAFLSQFEEFQAQLACYGALNSLGQVLLKITSPGVPDFYQGLELWDFSMVDPDNRHPVDFEERRRMLDHLLLWEDRDMQSLVHRLCSSWRDGLIKLYVVSRALRLRRSHADLFWYGDYVPIRVEGRRQEHVCAFARRLGDEWAVTAVPRLITRLVSMGELPVGGEVWGEDCLILPEDAPRCWLNAYTGVYVEAHGNALPLSEVLAMFPVSLLLGMRDFD